MTSLQFLFFLILGPLDTWIMPGELYGATFFYFAVTSRPLNFSLLFLLLALTSDLADPFYIITSLNEHKQSLLEDRPSLCSVFPVFVSEYESHLLFSMFFLAGRNAHSCISLCNENI